MHCHPEGRYRTTPLAQCCRLSGLRPSRIRRGHRDHFLQGKLERQFLKLLLEKTLTVVGQRGQAVDHVQVVVDTAVLVLVVARDLGCLERAKIPLGIIRSAKLKRIWVH